MTDPARPSKRPPQGPPRPSKRPPGGDAQEPRPSKRPPQGPPRPSRRPPQNGQGPHDRRPPQAPVRQGNGPPAIPRAPRVPVEARAEGRPPRAPQGPPPRDPRRQPPPRPQGPPRDAPKAPPYEPSPLASRDAVLPRGTLLPEPPPAAPAPAAPRRVFLPLASEEAAGDDLGEPEFPEYDWPEGASLVSVAMVRVADAPRAVACDAGGLTLRRGDAVMLEGERGVDLGTVTAAPRRQLVATRPAYRALRRAGEGDLRAEARTRLREAEALRTAASVVRELKVPAKVVRAECSSSGGRTTVYLASEERLDLRDVGRALTAALRGRVEIRHLGVRDAARNLGGVGPCGLQLCCNTFLSDFAPVSIRQAKDQGLALNPQRVSGVCGRLMCCLVYEDAFYRQQRALFPKQGKRVTTPRGEGRVRDVDVLARTVRVAFPDGPVETFTVDDVRAVFAPGSPASMEPPQADEAPEEPST